MAAVLALPFAEASPWPDMLWELRAAGYTLVALTPEASAEPLPAVAASLGRARVALLLGSEGEGLSPAALAAVDRRVRIPMAPGARLAQRRHRRRGGTVCSDFGCQVLVQVLSARCVRASAAGREPRSARCSA